LGWLAQWPVRTLGIKLGDAGCVIREQGETTHYPAYQVDVVDGSGAGDAFMAGFLYGCLHGWETARAAQFANATAAHCIQAIGCSAGVPPCDEVVRFLAVDPPLRTT
jgi:5-dehydro-2-deoxygluconokinase